MTLITSPESDASSVGSFGIPQEGQKEIDTLFYQQCSRQFTPLVLYPKADHMNQHHPIDSKQSFDQHDDPKTEKQVNHHLARINEMLEQNAKWWADQERIPPVTLSEEATPASLHKKGFVLVDTASETKLDDNDNESIDMLPSTSTSSTSSNSSSDTNDSISTTIVTTPNKMSMATLMITPALSAITPLEPKTDIPPQPLYHQSGRLSASASMTTTSNVDTSTYYRRRHRHSTAGIYYNPPPTPQSPPPLLFQAPPTRATTSTPPSPTSISSFSSTSSKLNSYSPSTATKPASVHTTQILEEDEDEEDAYYPRYYHGSSELAMPTCSNNTNNKAMDPGFKKRRRGNLPKQVTEFLKCWLLQHKKHPYPTERQKLELAQRTGLAVNQISNWFINARRRILQPMLETELILARQHQQQQQQPLYMNHHATRLQQSAYYYASPIMAPVIEEKKRRQLDIYAYHGFTETTHDDTQRWSIRRTKLPNIEIPDKDKHIFAGDS